MTRSDSITDSVDVNLSTLRDRGQRGGRAAVHGADRAAEQKQQHSARDAPKQSPRTRDPGRPRRGQAGLPAAGPHLRPAGRPRSHRVGRKGGRGSTSGNLNTSLESTAQNERFSEPLSILHQKALKPYHQQSSTSFSGGLRREGGVLHRIAIFSEGNPTTRADTCFSPLLPAGHSLHQQLSRRKPRQGQRRERLGEKRSSCACG